MSDQDEQEQVETPEQDESPLDVMRDSGVGLSDPNIVGDPEPGVVDAEFSDDEPQV